MLRRTATTIKLTPEDILEYDDSLARNPQKYASYDETNNDEQDNSALRYKDDQSRDERIGVRQPRIQQPRHQ
ncbi:hypothetical protein ABC855_g4706 [[Candida] zeylanoides]